MPATPERPTTCPRGYGTSLPPAVGAALFLLLPSCQDQVTEPPPQAADSAFSISDARAGAVAQRNPGFFWLPPAAPQPKSAELGTFHESLQPAVEVVCQARLRDGSPVDDAECDGDDVIVRYTRDDGLAEEGDHYALHVDASALDAGTGSETLVYRIIAYTDPLTELGGPFVLGHLDFRLDAAGPRRGGASGGDGDILSVNANRTLPMRFRIDRGAYEWELVSNGATAPNEPGAPLCEVNCSVTVIDPLEETEASLTDPDTGEEVTAVVFPAGALDESAVLVIDERTTEGPDATCAPGYAPASATSCFRYVITYTDPFNVDVPFGICPSEEVELGEGTLWDLVKVDYDDGEPVVSFPPSFDASPFLACGGPTGTPIGFIHRFLDWLVPAAYAGDTRVWGGTVRDFSDILWAIDAELTMDPLPESATSGSTIPVRVRWVATHPTLHDEEPVGIEGAEFTFSVGGGGGELLPPEGIEPVDVVEDDDGVAIAMTLLTDTDGFAGLDWRVESVNSTISVANGAATRAVTVQVISELLPQDALSASWQQTCALDVDGHAYCWGNNGDGQLGAGYTSNSESVPTPVAGGHRFKAIRTGIRATCGLEVSGGLYCWGNWLLNRAASVEPVRKDARTYTRIAADMNHGCAIDTAGDVYCWGGSGDGEIGNGTNDSWVEVPTRALNPEPMVEIAAGSGHVCAIGVSGDTYCWGRGQAGQIGNGASEDANAPERVETNQRFVQLALGAGHSCGLTETGEMFCWGSGHFGSTTSYETSSTPVPAGAGLRFRNATGGPGSTCATTAAGIGYCWGGTGWGQLGLPAGLVVVEPEPVGNFAYLSVALQASHSCGIRTNGTVECAGAELHGVLGDGSSGIVTNPQPVGAPADFIAVSSGNDHSCGLTGNGQAWCWGGGSQGQLGNGSLETAAEPLAVDGNHLFVDINAAYRHTCGLDVEGDVWCWGQNSSGQLGIGSASEPVATPQRVQADGLSFSSLAAGGMTASCAITAQGNAYCWGGNSSGAFGDGGTEPSVTPVPAAAGVLLAHMSLGIFHSCGVALDGTGYCWGSNIGGSLGADLPDGLITQPAEVSGEHTWQHIQVGQRSSCGIATDQSTYCWGTNGSGQLGTGDTQNRSLPTSVAGQIAFTQVDLGERSACGVTAIGTLYCWGSNEAGQVGAEIGEGPWHSEPSPQQVDNLSNVRAVAVGADYACALAGSGTYCWGSRFDGRLGDGSPGYREFFGPVSGSLTAPTGTP